MSGPAAALKVSHCHNVYITQINTQTYSNQPTCTQKLSEQPWAGPLCCWWSSYHVGGLYSPLYAVEFSVRLHAVCLRPLWPFSSSLRCSWYQSELVSCSVEDSWRISEVVLWGFWLFTHWLRHRLDQTASRESLGVDRDHLGWWKHRLWSCL